MKTASTTMQPRFWLDRWQIGQVGFHQSSVDRNLRRHWSTLGIKPPGRVLVPLCGKSLDLLWIKNQGYRVVGSELSDIAAQLFFAENGVLARRRVQAHFDTYEAEDLELIRGDFFALTAERIAEVVAIYDRAALISWVLDLRTKYVEHTARITGAGTKTFLVVLEYPQAEMPGPPFSVDIVEIHRLYSHLYIIEELDRQDILTQEVGMRARGVSRVSEICYQLTRL